MRPLAVIDSQYAFGGDDVQFLNWRSQKITVSEYRQHFLIILEFYENHCGIKGKEPEKHGT